MTDLAYSIRQAWIADMSRPSLWERVREFLNRVEAP